MARELAIENGKLKSDLDANGNGVKNLSAPVSDNDAATKKYVDEHRGPAPSWSDIADKPTTFPPEAHTHTKSEITDFPTSMPPTAHSHASDNWFTTAINSKADEAKPSFSTITINGVDYTEWTLGTRSGKIMLSVDMGGASTEIAAFNPVTGVFVSAPSQYRNTLRFDGEAPVVGVSPTLFDHVARESALSGKANISHTHTKSEITDFPTSMPPTAHSHANDGWFTTAIESVKSWASGVFAAITHSHASDSWFTSALSDKVGSFAAVGGVTPTVSGGVADVSALFSIANTSLMGVVRYAFNSDGTIKDRAINAITYAGGALPNFPAQVSGYARDFLLNVTATATASDITLPETGATSVGDALAFETSHTYLVAITEIAAKHYYIRIIDTTPQN